MTTVLPSYTTSRDVIEPRLHPPLPSVRKGRRSLSVGGAHGTLEIQRRKLTILRGAPSADREQEFLG